MHVRRQGYFFTHNGKIETGGRQTIDIRNSKSVRKRCRQALSTSTYGSRKIDDSEYSKIHS